MNLIDYIKSFLPTQTVTVTEYVEVPVTKYVTYPSPWDLNPYGKSIDTVAFELKGQTPLQTASNVDLWLRTWFDGTQRYEFHYERRDPLDIFADVVDSGTTGDCTDRARLFQELCRRADCPYVSTEHGYFDDAKHDRARLNVPVDFIDTDLREFMLVGDGVW